MNATPRQSIIFGGAGFIGRHLAEALHAAYPDGRLVIVDRVEPQRLPDGAVFRHLDVREPIPDEFATGDRRIFVYNLAAVHRTPGHPTHEYYETNVRGAVNINDFARRVGAADLLFTSSIAVYGPDDAPKRETTPPTPESAYGWSKWLAESVHRSWSAEAPGRRLTIVRPAVIFGAGEGGNFTRLAGALGRGTFVFAGRRDTVKACGYVGELVRALEYVHAHNSGEIIFNFCYDREYSIDEICETFERVGDLKKPLGTVPLPLMLLGGFAFEVLNGLGLRNAINRDRIRKLVDSTNIEPAVLREMGYQYETDLEEALRRWWASEPAGAFV